MDKLLTLNADGIDDNLVRFVRANRCLCVDYEDEKCNNMLQVIIAKSPHNIKTIACLLESYPSLTKRNNRDGWNALHTAVEYQNIFCVDQIIRVNPTAMYDRGRDDRTPFQMAVECGDLEIVKHMITRDPNVIHQRNRQNVSVLHLATDLEVVVYLLSCKPALIDAVDDHQNTPLHYHLGLRSIGQLKYAKTVECLLQKKAFAFVCERGPWPNGIGNCYTAFEHCTHCIVVYPV